MPKALCRSFSPVIYTQKSFISALSARMLQTWGLDKYHGGQWGSRSNWPGVDLPALEIPAESFLLHFHSEGRSEDSKNDYGFRLTAEGSYPVFPEPAPSSVEGGARHPSTFDDMSVWPMYLGQPPPHASRRQTIDGGLLSRVRAWNRPLVVEEIETLAAEPPLDAVSAPAAVDAAETAAGSDSSGVDIDRNGENRADGAGGLAAEEHAGPAAVQVLALAHACCRAEFGRGEFSAAGTVRALLRLALVGEAETRTSALRVFQVALPWVEPSVVDDEFRCVLDQLVM